MLVGDLVTFWTNWLAVAVSAFIVTVHRPDSVINPLIALSAKIPKMSNDSFKGTTEELSFV